MSDDKTNIWVLSIVAIVALVAIVFMIISASNAPSVASDSEVFGQAISVADINTNDAGASSILGVCGDGTVDENEDCDGTNLNGKNCESVYGAGYTGTLACKDDNSGSPCKFDPSGCYKLV